MLTVESTLAKPTSRESHESHVHGNPDLPYQCTGNLTARRADGQAAHLYIALHYIAINIFLLPRNTSRTYHPSRQLHNATATASAHSSLAFNLQRAASLVWRRYIDIILPDRCCASCIPAMTTDEATPSDRARVSIPTGQYLCVHNGSLAGLGSVVTSSFANHFCSSTDIIHQQPTPQPHETHYSPTAGTMPGHRPRVGRRTSICRDIVLHQVPQWQQQPL